MPDERCKECKRALVLDEENLCAVCELSQKKMEENTPDVNCGICKDIVEEDSEGLYCDVCSSWFHNECNESPLNYELYGLLNEAPNNVKWFCDKCIWETEKWINGINSKHTQSSRDVVNSKKMLNKVKQEPSEENEEVIEEESDENSDWINEEGNDDVHQDDEEHQDDNEDVSLSRPDLKMNMDIKMYDNEDLEDMSNQLDISPAKLSNITDGIRYVKKEGKYKKSKCNICPKTFLHFEDCIAHKLKDHEGVQKPYKCPECGKTFESKRGKYLHRETHSSDKRYTCDICGKTLKHAFSLQSHMKMLHSDENIILHNCTECEYTTKYKTALKTHTIINHSGETKFQCKICNKSFALDQYLKLHMAVHNSDKPFACELCNTKFKREGDRKRHMLTHVTEKLFECTECDKRFATKKLLTKHMLFHIPIELRPHACDECDLRFLNISALNVHKKKHTGVFEAICDICGKGFTSPYSLKQHTMMHTDERPLKCEICGKGFRSSGHLSLHIKYHKKIVTARCPICGFGAPTKSVLNSHIKNVHKNETPFECNICGNKYKTNGNLSKHKRGIRGSCKGSNTSTLTVQENRESKTSHKSYFEQPERKQDLSIPAQETRIATARMPSEQNYGIHPSLLLYANSQNSHAYASQYHGSFIPPNPRGIAENIQTSHIDY